VAIQIFKIKEKTEAGLNVLIGVFLKNNTITETIYKEDYIAFVFPD